MFELPGPESFESEDAIPQFFAATFIAGDWLGARTAVDGLASSRRLTRMTNALVDLRTGSVANAHRSLAGLRLDGDSAPEVFDVSIMSRSALSLAAVLAKQPTEVSSVAAEGSAEVSHHSW